MDVGQNYVWIVPWHYASSGMRDPVGYSVHKDEDSARAWCNEHIRQDRNSPKSHSSGHSYLTTTNAGKQAIVNDEVYELMQTSGGFRCIGKLETITNFELTRVIKDGADK